MQDSNWNILRNLIDENHFLRKYKERTRQWRQVAGHKDSFVEGQNQVRPPLPTLLRPLSQLQISTGFHLEYNLEEI